MVLINLYAEKKRHAGIENGLVDKEREAEVRTN